MEIDMSSSSGTKTILKVMFGVEPHGITPQRISDRTVLTFWVKHNRASTISEHNIVLRITASKSHDSS